MKKFIIITLLCSLSWSQEIRRPSVEANDTSASPCTGSQLASSTMPLFYDAAGDATSSTQTSSSVSGIDQYKQRKFTTWAAASGGYASLALKIRSQCVGTPAFPITAEQGACGVQYSINSGATWTTVRFASGNGTIWATTTDSISLSPSQNLAQLQVRICVAGIADSGHNGTGTLTGYDIRTEGILGIIQRRSQAIVVKENKNANPGTWRRVRLAFQRP